MFSDIFYYNSPESKQAAMSSLRTHCSCRAGTEREQTGILDIADLIAKTPSRLTEVLSKGLGSQLEKAPAGHLLDN